jgi:hypothetical protein
VCLARRLLMRRMSRADLQGWKDTLSEWSEAGLVSPEAESLFVWWLEGPAFSVAQADKFCAEIARLEERGEISPEVLDAVRYACRDVKGNATWREKMLEYAKGTARLFSNTGRPERERLVAREFLKYLDIRVTCDALQVPPVGQDVDVIFEAARFQVTEWLEEDRRRHLETREFVKLVENMLEASPTQRFHFGRRHRRTVPGSSMDCFMRSPPRRRRPRHGDRSIFSCTSISGMGTFIPKARR